MGLIADAIKDLNISQEEVYEVPEEDIEIITDPNIPVDIDYNPNNNFGFPTQSEYNKQVQEKEESLNSQDDLQNLTHNNQCRLCMKAINMSGNPKAVMRFCKFSCAMVSKYQTSCSQFKKKDLSNVDLGWVPGGDIRNI